MVSIQVLIEALVPSNIPYASGVSTMIKEITKDILESATIFTTMCFTSPTIATILESTPLTTWLVRAHYNPNDFMKEYGIILCAAPVFMMQF